MLMILQVRDGSLIYIGFSETCIPAGILVNPTSLEAFNSGIPLVFSE